MNIKVINLIDSANLYVITKLIIKINLNLRFRHNLNKIKCMINLMKVIKVLLHMAPVLCK